MSDARTPPTRTPPTPAANPAPVRELYDPGVKPPSVMLAGDPGDGKTTSLVTLLEAGIECFVVPTDLNGMDSLLDAVRNDPKTRLPRKNAGDLIKLLHWSNLTPAPAGWGTLREMARTITAMNYADLSNMKGGIDKAKTNLVNSWIELMSDFVCDRTGEHFGDVTQFDDKRAVIIDSLSGINKMAKEHVVGFKPTLHQGEWGTAMNLEEQIIYSLLAQCQCYVVVTAHRDKVQNEITGTPEISIAALGNKLAPQLVKNFSEVVRAYRNKDQFFWSTSETNMPVKNRALPIGDKLPPTFAPIILAHEARKKLSAL